jgi:hypothetical protein
LPASVSGGQRIVTDLELVLVPPAVSRPEILIVAVPAAPVATVNVA